MKSYEQGYRARVDSLKEDLKTSYQNKEEEFEVEKIEREPGFFRKIGRTALDLVGIHPYASEKRRNREAMATALREYREEAEEEKTERFNEELAKDTERGLRYEINKILDEDRKKQEDDERLAWQMAEGRKNAEIKRKTELKQERVQEIVEQELNSKLTTIDKLDDAVNAEDPGIAKRSLEYDGEEIPVYDLRGLPFGILSTALDYRGLDEHSGIPTIGKNTMVNLLNNPALWNTPEHEMAKQEGFGEWFGSENARGNTISASYVNSEERNTNDRRVHNGGAYEITGTTRNLCYGFSRLEGDAIIRITLGDGGNSNGMGHDKTDLWSPDEVGRMENINHATYNEVLLRRYSETGMPRKPDYIIAEDGEITDTFLKHAKFWGIPILNIETKYYEDHVRMTDEEWQRHQEERQKNYPETA